MKTLVIAAHPDDEILGVGGTILKRIESKHEVYILILCDCLAPRNDELLIENVRSISCKIAKKISISKLFQAKLGTNTNQRLDELPFKLVIDSIQKIINLVKPDEIFTHHHSDWNTDHQIAFKATISASRTINKFLVKKIFSYEVASSTEQAPNMNKYVFLPNKFIEISKFLDKKLEILSMYKSEIFSFPHTRSLKYVELQAKLWGAKNGIDAAEAFYIVRDIE